jgi:chemotaxis protein CheX
VVAAVNDDAVQQVVIDIWSSILALDVVPAQESAMAKPSVTGIVHISGESDGSVSLECPMGLAQRAAALMFGMEPDELGAGEVEDALGELTNMTGGGVKSLLPGQNQLSLPTVVEGTGYHLNVPGSVPVRDVWFTCDGEPLVVRIYERATAGARVPA